MNPRKVTAIIWFLGLVAMIFIRSNVFWIFWLLFGAIVMYIETGIDTNWIVEKKVWNFIRRKQ